MTSLLSPWFLNFKIQNTISKIIWPRCALQVCYDFERASLRFAARAKDVMLPCSKSLHTHIAIWTLFNVHISHLVIDFRLHILLIKSQRARMAAVHANRARAAYFSRSCTCLAKNCDWSIFDSKINDRKKTDKDKNHVLLSCTY